VNTANPASAKAMMRLGLFFEGLGHHIAAWRDPAIDPRAKLGIEHYFEIARTAERGKFDMVFTADTNATFGPDDPASWSRTSAAARLEPLTLLAAMSAVTERIGLVATMTTTYHEPFTIARFFASLDLISGGRAGWNLVTSAAAAEAVNFSHTAHASPVERYARAKEAAQVVLGLWDSWEDDALLGDKATGLYVDPAKVHFLAHKGRHFSVRGPLMIPRSPQGHPVLVQAGQSDGGRDLAAATAEVVFTVQQDIEEARAFYADIKRRAAALGRSPDALKILPGVMIVVGTTTAAAEAKYERLQALIPPDFGLRHLSSVFGVDLSQLPLDGPVPELDYPVTQHGRLKLLLDLARRERLSIRQLYKRVVGQRGHRTVCGTPAEIADALESWFAAGACDGFNIMPLTFPHGLDDIVDHVIPELQRRGLFRTEYEGRTLRENLGLPIPTNARHASTPREEAAAARRSVTDPHPDEETL
jgi:FMN-dependent oxidoreductase (nitrilotriacetate monooxygenase family)